MWDLKSKRGLLFQWCQNRMSGENDFFCLKWPDTLSSPERWSDIISLPERWPDIILQVKVALEASRYRTADLVRTTYFHHTYKLPTLACIHGTTFTCHVLGVAEGEVELSAAQHGQQEESHGQALTCRLPAHASKHHRGLQWNLSINETLGSAILSSVVEEAILILKVKYKLLL